MKRRSVAIDAGNENMSKTTPSRIYAVCPHCEHPNIHVSDGIIAKHTMHTGTHVHCIGSGMTANEQHNSPLNRHTSEYQIALQMAQSRAFVEVPEVKTIRPTFRTWTFSGIQFIAVPIDRNSEHIMDALGGNYGSWMSVDEFRKRQQAGIIADWQSLGRAHLQVVCDR